MPMLEGEPELTLELLSRATQAWVEHELRRAFRTERVRPQRLSDGTITVEGVRYEIPSAYRTLQRIHV